MRAHPWHPALVHFPIACWSLATLIDVAALVGALPERIATRIPGLEPSALSFALLWLGVALGLIAMTAGFVDFLKLPTRLQQSGAISWHIGAMTGAWGLFLAAALLRPMPAAPFPPPALVATLIEIVGFACLVGGGFLAATVVFEDWPRPPRNEVSSISTRGSTSGGENADRETFSSPACSMHEFEDDLVPKSRHVQSANSGTRGSHTVPTDPDVNGNTSA